MCIRDRLWAANQSITHFFISNIMNDFKMRLDTISLTHAKELELTIEDKIRWITYFLLMPLTFLFLSVILGFPVFAKVSRTKEEVLSLFLEIPDATVRLLYARCENFLGDLQSDDRDDELMSEMDEEMLVPKNDDDESSDFLSQKKKKKFKREKKSTFMFFMQMVLGALIIQLYFISNFYLANQLLSDTIAYTHELNQTALVEPLFGFSSNVKRILILDPSKEVLKTSSYQAAWDTVEQSTELLANLSKNQYTINFQSLDSSYRTLYRQIMFEGPCEVIFSLPADIDKCVQDLHGLPDHGMEVMLTKFISNMRYILLKYNQLVLRGQSTWETRSEITSLLEYQEIDKMDGNYIRLVFRYLIDQLQKIVDQDFDSHNTRRLGLYIGFTCVVVLIYVAFWLPLVFRLNKNLWRTKSMLRIIPINVISKQKRIRKYLRNLISATRQQQQISFHLFPLFHLQYTFPSNSQFVRLPQRLPFPDCLLKIG
eukprot:TRINITY_DN12704_c0_g1_i6.p1 TRINITY_DN12704_c0_g1~~TRINITY_DN12704_c0_g1_i6.p1  ORF type:complete len:516 (-),score=90.36 TRINITY_DN12704_c0_g1_i6:150-1601(-)